MASVLFVSPDARAQETVAMPNGNERLAVTAISDAALRAHIRFLADDLLEGRKR